jgi:hypothetical protein
LAVNGADRKSQLHPEEGAPELGPDGDLARRWHA